MKIAQVVCVFRPYKGGIGEVAYDYAHQLQKHGHTCTVFTPRYNTSQNKKEIIDTIEVRRLTPLLKYGNAAVLLSLFKYLKHFDIVHLHYPFYGSAEIVYLLKKITGKNCKLVITYHMDVNTKGIFSYFFKFHSKYIMPYIIKSADKIIVSSLDYAKNSNIKNIIKKYPEKFFEIPFGVNPLFKTVNLSQNDYDHLNLNKKSKYILFVANLDKAHYFKGLENLLRALSKINDQNKRLIIVGKGDMKKYYENLTKDLKIEEKVTFLGFISDETLVKLYNLCNLYVLPAINSNEAFGIAALQALACKKPVIASNLPGVRSVTQNNYNGLLFNPHDIDDLAKKINYLLDNESIAKKFGVNGYNLIKEKYNWTNVGNKLNALYKQL